MGVNRGEEKSRLDRNGNRKQGSQDQKSKVNRDEKKVEKLCFLLVFHSIKDNNRSPLRALLISFITETWQKAQGGGVRGEQGTGRLFNSIPKAACSLTPEMGLQAAWKLCSIAFTVYFLL